MKIRAQGMDSYEARVANTHLPESDLERQNRVPCIGNVFVTGAQMLRSGEKEHYRPYLQLSGEVRSVEGHFLDKDMTLVFPTDRNYPKFDCKYNFTNDELAELVEKGLFDDGFGIPDIFIDNDFELPMLCNICSVKSPDIPIIFVSIENAYGLETSRAESGYSLSQYFEKAVQPDMPFIEEEPEEVYSDQIDDVGHTAENSEPEASDDVQESKSEPEKADVQLQRSLHNVEKYSEQRVAERQKRLSGKSTENKFGIDSQTREYGEDYVRDDITYKSAQQAVNNVGSPNSGRKFSDDVFSNDSIFMDDSDFDAIDDTSGSVGSTGSGSRKQNVSEVDLTPAAKREMTFGERVASEMFNHSQSELKSAGDSQIGDLFADSNSDDEFIGGNDTVDKTETESVDEQNEADDMMFDSPETDETGFDDVDEVKDRTAEKAKKRNAVFTAIGDIKEASARDKVKRRAAMTAHVQEIADESAKQDFDLTESSDFDFQ